MGGAFLFDFVNSIDWMVDGVLIECEDVLLELDLLVCWGCWFGVLGGGEDGVVGGVVVGEVGVVLELVVVCCFCLVLRAVLIAAVHGEAPREDEFGFVMRIYVEVVVIVWFFLCDDGVYVLDWLDSDFCKVWFVVIVDAIVLFGDVVWLERVHVCFGCDCGWLFLNKSGRQWWCLMAMCGSCVKMRVMYVCWL